MKLRFLFAAGLAAGVASAAVGPAARTVEDDFLDPPRAARPYVWWHWMGSNVTDFGIERDIDAMAGAGVGGAVIFSLAAQCGPWAGLTNAVNPKLRYRNDEYWRLFKVAADAAERAGIRLAFHNCPGYTVSGGDWIKPENAMKKIIQWARTGVKIVVKEK